MDQTRRKSGATERTLVLRPAAGKDVNTTVAPILDDRAPVTGGSPCGLPRKSVRATGLPLLELAGQS